MSNQPTGISERDLELAELLGEMAKIAGDEGDSETCSRLCEAKEVYLSGNSAKLAELLQTQTGNLPVLRFEEAHFARYNLELAIADSEANIHRLTALFRKNAKGESLKSNRSNKEIFRTACRRMKGYVDGETTGQTLVELGLSTGLPAYLNRAYKMTEFWSMPETIVEDCFRSQAEVGLDEGPRLSG